MLRPSHPSDGYGMKTAPIRAHEAAQKETQRPL
jgi:hypothetical protein